MDAGRVFTIERHAAVHTVTAENDLRKRGSGYVGVTSGFFPDELHKLAERKVDVEQRVEIKPDDVVDRINIQQVPDDGFRF